MKVIYLTRHKHEAINLSPLSLKGLGLRCCNKALIASQPLAGLQLLPDNLKVLETMTSSQFILLLSLILKLDLPMGINLQYYGECPLIVGWRRYQFIALMAQPYLSAVN
jgi:hypothetical protein